MTLRFQFRLRMRMAVEMIVWRQRSVPDAHLQIQQHSTLPYQHHNPTEFGASRQGIFYIIATGGLALVCPCSNGGNTIIFGQTITGLFLANGRFF